VRLLSLVLLIGLTGIASGQQTVRDEDAYLQELMRHADAKTVTKSGPEISASARPLKVCVITPEQDKVAADFAEWLDRWNASEGGRYGQVESVTDAAQADIILARFVSLDVKAKPSGDEGSSVKNDLLIDPVSHRPIPTAEAKKPVHYYANVSSFVVARDAEGLKLLWRGTDEVSVDESHRVSYGERKGSKDSKKAGDRLRDKFFEMLKARTHLPKLKLDSKLRVQS
jgi:hypothetical protein